MAIKQYPRFPKGSWVRVVHPQHPYYDRVGKIAIAGKEASEVEFKEESGIVRKPFMNTALQAEETPRELAPGQGVVVTAESSPYFQRRGVIRALIAGNEIALVDFHNRFRDGAGKVHGHEAQIHCSDLQILESSSSGTDKGDRKLRSAQG